jgi:acyl-CoA synthetase (AMP-forming)/AMP-acid ligase II
LFVLPPTDTYLDGGRCSTNGWYATGDLVAFGPSGFEFLGRCDDQIKLRGFRVELNEVTQLLRDQTKSRVITLAWPPPPKPAEMIFSFVEKENITPTEMIKLVEACRLQLPEYMVPFDIFALQPFPLTANGKIDFESLRKIIDKSLA